MRKVDDHLSLAGRELAPLVPAIDTRREVQVVGGLDRVDDRCTDLALGAQYSYSHAAKPICPEAGARRRAQPATNDFGRHFGNAFRPIGTAASDINDAQVNLLADEMALVDTSMPTQTRGLVRAQ